MIKLTTTSGLTMHVDPAAITAVIEGDEYTAAAVWIGDRHQPIEDSYDDVLKLIDDALVEEAFDEAIIDDMVSEDEVDASVEDRLDWCEEAVANLDARITEALAKLGVKS